MDTGSVNDITPPAGFQLDPPAQQFVTALQSDPNRPAVSVLPPETVNASPQSFFGEDGQPFTVAQVHDQQSNGAVPPRFARYSDQQMLQSLDKANSSLTGDEYLKQFAPEIQSAVRAYVDGRSRPAGSRGWPVLIKAIATKYGDDVGTPADDAMFGARQTMRRDLGKTNAQGIGGQVGAVNTAVNHLAHMSDYAVGLNNWDLGVTPLTHGVNWLRDLGTGQAATLDKLNDAAQHYGQEITRYYAGSQGGVEERNRFMQTVDGAKSPQQLAAILETELDLMTGRNNEVQRKIQETLGDRGVQQYPVLSPQAQADIARLRANIARLRGQSGADSGAQAPTSTPQIGDRQSYDALPPGSTYVDTRDGRTKIKKGQ